MKKTMMKLTALALVALMLLGSLVSCSSSFGKIKRNFKKAGYTYVEPSKDDEGNTANKITAELGKGNLECTAHIFKADGFAGFDVIALVLEFKSDKDLQKALDEGSETLKGLLKDLQQSELIRGNCLLVPLSFTKTEDMIETFNK